MAEESSLGGIVGRTVILADGRRAKIRRVVEDDELYIVDVIGEERRADARDRLVLANSVSLVGEGSGHSGL